MTNLKDQVYYHFTDKVAAILPLRLWCDLWRKVPRNHTESIHRQLREASKYARISTPIWSTLKWQLQHHIYNQLKEDC